MPDVASREIFRFQWPVDQSGYEIEEHHGRGNTAADRYHYEVIRPRGGPPRFYRPLEEDSGLWRRFAESCATTEGALEFASKYGVLSDSPCVLDGVFRLAEHLRALMYSIDLRHWDIAAGTFNLGPRPRLTARMKGPNQRGRFEFVLAPCDLGGAFLLQAGEAITGNQEFRRCKNCSTWMRIGDGGYSVRRKFCSTKCRVAWARRA